MLHVRALFAASFVAAALPASADNVHQEAVQFPRGASGTTLNGSIKGYDSVRYSVDVGAGQRMSLQLDPSNASTYFNVTAPGASEAMYNSSVDGNATTLTIPSSGNYIVEIYMMRNAARRNEVSNYAMTVYVE